MKVLIVGYGSIAKKHVTAIRKINPLAEIYALRSNKLANDEPAIINIFSLEEAKTLDIDFIIVSTPTNLHFKNIEELIPFEKPLFIEKPLSDSLQIASVLPEIESSNIPTYVACNLRFLDVLRYVKDKYINKSYKINEVNSYCGSFLPDWRPDQDYKKSYSASSKMGGGVHLDLIHELDYIYWLFGHPITVNKVLKSKSSIGIEAIDYANYTLEYENFTSSIILNYYRRDPKRSLEILTDQCTVLVDILKNQVYENGNLVFESKQLILDTYENQLNWFIALIDKKEMNTFNSVIEAYEVLKIALK